MIFLGLAALAAAIPAAERPNVVIVMTDDQGFGDLGADGNPAIRTPNLDGLARDGARFASFYVSPVCSPTRSSLLTGRYCYRTGVIDTFRGRSLMYPDEVTLAEHLGAAGYATGIFGKWHLGDNYPMRPGDQGFRRSAVHRGGGIVQPAGPPGDSYFNPQIIRDGRVEQGKGYCTDIFTDEAIAFIREPREQPFFCYLAYNAPHTPLEVADELWKPCLERLRSAKFPDAGRAAEGKEDLETTARVYAMVEQVDRNVGRLLKALDEMKIADETLVIFLTDNGPQQPRWNAGLRGLKTTAFEGGIRVPCFWRWPRKVPAGATVRGVAAHIDVVPTILEAVGAAKVGDKPLDGISLWPALRDPEGVAIPPDRVYATQWHRGDVPRRGWGFAIRSGPFKLVQPRGIPEGKPVGDPPMPLLFDIEADPGEQNDLAAARPDVTRRLLGEYERWFDSVRRDRWFEPPRIVVGNPNEEETLLTRQDWRGPRADWNAEGMGHWEIAVDRPGAYRITLSFDPLPLEATARIMFRGRERNTPVKAGATSAVFSDVDLPRGPGRLSAELRAENVWRGATYVDLRAQEFDARRPQTTPTLP